MTGLMLQNALNSMASLPITNVIASVDSSNSQGRYIHLESIWKPDLKQTQEAQEHWVQRRLGFLFAKETSETGCTRWTCMVLFDAQDDGTLEDGMYLPWNPDIEYKNLPQWILGSYTRTGDSLGNFLKAIILGWESYTSDIEEDVVKVFESSVFYVLS